MSGQLMGGEEPRLAFDHMLDLLACTEEEVVTLRDEERFTAAAVDPNWTLGIATDARTCRAKRSRR
jgi:hypothetical protein